MLRRTTFLALLTLLFVDGCGQFGYVRNALKLIGNYMRGQAVKLLAFFQDIGQVRTMFGTDFSKFVNSSSAITAPPGTGMAARETAENPAFRPRPGRSPRDKELFITPDGTSGAQCIPAAIQRAKGA